MSDTGPGRSAEPACRVAGILLAAGASRRFGAANKLLATLHGKPLVRHVAEALSAARLAEIVLVTGPDADEVVAALAGIAVRTVHNPHHADGMGGSVATGIAALGPDVDGALITPGDMPGLTPHFIARLLTAFVDNGGDAIVYAATTDGAQRNPVIWPRHLFSQLVRLTGEQGAKSILAAHRERAIAVAADDAIFEDIDTTADLSRHATRS